MTPKSQDCTITLLILAGGKSTRFGGTDKGLVHFHHQTLVEHLIQTFQPYVQDIIINANRNLDTYRSIHANVVSDAFEGFLGPLAGIHAALAHCKTDWLFSIACDMPLVQPEVLTQMSAQLRQSTCHAVLAKSASGFHPTCALIRNQPEIQHSLAQTLQQENYKLMHWFQQIETEFVYFEQESLFTNTNTYEELLTIERTLSS